MSGVSCSLHHAAAARTAAWDTSRLASTTPISCTCPNAEVTSAAVSSAFAPGATEIWFSPSGPTQISATPVGTPGRIATEVATPSARSASSASCPSASFPTAPTSTTPWPPSARDAATAWFPPLPP